MNIFAKSNNERSQQAKVNILKMLFLKGGNILIGFMLVPMTINYVDSETYGIWLTISSMVAWISFFDIGINNGLKNKLTEALAKNDIEMAKAYVSTTYAILSAIFIPLMVVLIAAAPLINWQSLLNINTVDASTLLYSVCIVLGYFCINFILSTINVVLLADQKPADVSLRSFLQQILSLVVIYGMTKLIPGSLPNLCIALCLCPLALILIFNLTLFRSRYKEIAPSVSAIDFSLSPGLLKLGVQFFIIQIAAIVQYQMINFFIIHYFGATEVTAYNIAYKYFNVTYMVWGILTTPIWAAVTDAITKQDYKWIANTTKKYLMLLSLFVAGSFILLLISPFAYNLWIGDSVQIPYNLSAWVMIYNIVFMFGSIFVNILNGASILRVQTISSLISPIVFIGASMLLIQLGFGVISIIIAAIVSNFYGLVLAPLQYIKFIKRHTITNA